MDKHIQDRLRVMRYIDHHPVVTLSTIDDLGRPYGAVVYAVSGDHRSAMHIYFLTKSDTAKFHNLTARPAVSLTAYDEHDVSTLQAQGHAAVERDPRILDMAMKQLTRTHAHAEEWLPPIAKLRAGNYILVGVTVTHVRLGEFKGEPIGGNIFTDVK